MRALLSCPAQNRFLEGPSGLRRVHALPLAVKQRTIAVARALPAGPSPAGRPVTRGRTCRVRSAAGLCRGRLRRRGRADVVVEAGGPPGCPAASARRLRRGAAGGRRCRAPGLARAAGTGRAGARHLALRRDPNPDVSNKECIGDLLCAGLTPCQCKNIPRSRAPMRSLFETSGLEAASARREPTGANVAAASEMSKPDPSSTIRRPTCCTSPG